MAKVKSFQDGKRAQNIVLTLEEFEKLNRLCRDAELQVQIAEATYQRALLAANAEKNIEMRRLQEKYPALDLAVNYGFDESTRALVPKEK
jgi:hypothetical protein